MADDRTDSRLRFGHSPVASVPASASGANRSRRYLCSLGFALLGTIAAGCSSKGRAIDPATGTLTPVQAELQRVEFGRLVDVYGLQTGVNGSTIELFRRDVLIGGNIQDQRSASDNISDAEITYDFLGANPDTLQPQLFITREIGSADFQEALDALDDEVREIAPMAFGTNGPGNPFGVVPRNAAIRLSFTRDLGIDDSFFVDRDANGQVTALRNTDAVQLLKISGDPTQDNAFTPVPTRVIVDGRNLILDPVLLGTEGLQYQTTNNASGLPESPDQSGANLRVAIALEGALAIPGLKASSQNGLVGRNNSGLNSIVRDFRSGNASDTSADMTRGFVRDPLPLRIVGELPMLLEKVEDLNPLTQEVTVFKNGIVHEIDRGDVLRFVTGSLAAPLSGEVVADPEDDRGQPGVQHVRVRIRRLSGLDAIDPRNLPGYPASVAEREPWLVANAPRAVCIAEFEAGGRTENGIVRGDDPRYFLSFTPTPLANLDGTVPALNEFVSPFAGAVVRFTKPVDLSTVKWADTFFFAMRDLTTSASIDEFIASRPNNQGGTGMDPAAFNPAKYRTPYLVTARVYDENGSQTSVRLQPTTGFYLDDTMRNAPAGSDYRYFLHLIANSSEDGGIRDLSGNPVDLQGDTADRSNSVVIPFTIDTRMNGNQPYFDDNLAISLVHRFASRDEDSQPSYFLGNEIPAPGQGSFAEGYPLEDLVGGFVYVDGKLQPRPTTRVRAIADNLNQAPVGIQNTPLAWCPPTVSGENQISSGTAGTVLMQGLQNPLNPYGCRLQTCWREVDLSLSRTEPNDFNLDVEQMYWAPYAGATQTYDEFDRVSLWIGHSEYRPMPCIGNFSALPSLPESGLSTTFQRNFVWNPAPTGSGTTIESQPAPHPCYVDKVMTINPATAVFEPNGVNRFQPLPKFQKPYFVFRDETVVEQGISQDQSISESLLDGNDLAVTGTGAYQPHLLSPFNNGQGRRRVVTLLPAGLNFVNAFWNDAPNNSLSATGSREKFTGGLVGNIGLPLLADFWTYCDRPDLPVGDGYIASGANGWQISIPVQSSANPYFRAFSAGRVPVGGTASLCRAPGDSQWVTASGGYAPAGSGLTNPPPRDNTFYWIMLDLLKRQNVITNGFIDINNPHRVPEGFGDPRLGPFYLSGGQSTRPANVSPFFAYEFDPPLNKQPAGTSIVPQFRAAGVVDSAPWYWDKWINTVTPLFPATVFGPGPGPAGGPRDLLKPTPDNFPLDPYKAADAHIRKWDTRPIPGSGTTRNWWTYFYNRTVTRYTDDPNELMDPNFTIQFKGPNEVFTPNDVRYVNWRLVTSNNTDASPPVSPSIESFALSYRFQRIN
jgi:hypothetical protein